MNFTRKTLSRLGFLIICFGFFMPISCDQNGFELANFLIKSGGSGSNAMIAGFLLCFVFIFATLGVCSLFIKKDKKQIIFLNIVLILCSISSGIGSYLIMSSSIDVLQYGAYIIITGWIVALLLELFFLSKNTNSVKKGK